MLELVKSASRTPTNIGSVSLVGGGQMGWSFDPPQWFAAGKELLAPDAPAARIRKIIIEYEQFWAPWKSIPYSTLVDDSPVFYFQNTEAEAQSIGSLAQRRLESALHASFEADLLEDGLSHPAEEVIGQTLQSGKGPSVLGWLRVFCLDAAQPSFAASVLRCLGRQMDPGTDVWRVELVRNGLAMNDVEIRDAAVQAAESWGDSDMIDVLESHSEPVPWLQDYIHNVIDDLRK